jgi:acetylornithine/N-succinyldiaminopimelate aminotransferase
VFFGNSGSEANEAALKYARLYALRTKGPDHHRILCFTGAFHGRTMGALSCTPTAKYQDPFAPLVPGVAVAPYNDEAALERAFDAGFAAVIVEVVQGEGGHEPGVRRRAEPFLPEA